METLQINVHEPKPIEILWLFLARAQPFEMYVCIFEQIYAQSSEENFNNTTPK